MAYSSLERGNREKRYKISRQDRKENKRKIIER